MNKNLVSIIMNGHNGDKYLREAINSIFKQTYKKYSEQKAGCNNVYIFELSI